MSKDDKRSLLLQSTLELVAKQGFHGAPCAMIAEQAGVAAGTIYRYFENKDVLINELYISLESRITAVLLDGYSPDQPIRERFMHLGTGILNYFISHPLEFKYIEQFHNSPYGTAFRRDKFLGHADSGGDSRRCDIYKELFSEGLEQRVVKELPLILLFDLAFGPILAVARNHVLGFITLDETLMEQVVAACWDGLKR